MFTLKNLIENPGRLELLRATPRPCGCGCGQAISPVDGETERDGDGRPWRADCYYAALGEQVERHPIVGPRFLRG